MLAFLNQVRKPTLDLPLEVRRKMWAKDKKTNGEEAGCLHHVAGKWHQPQGAD